MHPKSPLKRALRAPAILTLAIGLLWGSAATAQVDPGFLRVREALLGWFAGYEFVPGPEHYKALGDPLEAALVSIIIDDRLHPLTRARAASATLYAVGEHSERALVELLETPQAEAILPRKAVLALAEGWGERHLGLITNVFLSARDDLRLREACARALRLMGPPAYATRDLLLRDEKDPVIRGILMETKDIE